ncbi:hypothetical protein [Halothiobacillus sp. DCM-1]|uniref:hypothetical protein n=1 Tax=Halothiobacillus sp. DCM-1 TaxID=3112558 RepID=UPI003253C4D6
MSQSIARPVVLVGVGEIGAIFAQGFLKLGHPVVPVTRAQTLMPVLAATPDAEALVLAVGEAALPEVLRAVPADWHDRLVLLQNELLPRDWLSAGIEDPTVISIWFEKKPGKVAKPLIPSPVYGRQSALVQAALATLNLPVRVVTSRAAMLQELVIKNVYILTTNIAGLRVGGDVATLWQAHRPLAEAVAAEVIALQEKLVQQPLDHAALIDGMLAGFEGDPTHACKGRTAAARLQRALLLAAELGLKLPTLQAIAAEQP